ncbi:MAG: hypothetical protein WCD45_11305 [Gallionella sp.]
MRPPNKFFLILCCALLLSACGSVPEKKSPAALQATRQIERGTAAFLQGDYAGALTEFALGLRIELSIENADGIAVSRINLARTWRELAHPEQAHVQLDALFAAPILPYPAESLAAAAVMQAQLYFEGDAPDVAAQWLDRGDVLCQKKCAATASLTLLRAQLLLHDGRYAQAQKLADESAATLIAPSQNIELANALRLSGEIYFAQHDDVNASAKFEQALALDQRAGLPAKIRLDLTRLAETAEHAGKNDEAKNYAARAASVSQAMREAHQIAQPPAH